MTHGEVFSWRARRKRVGGGFTLVELIIVIAIMAILCAALVPALIKYVEKAKLTRANTNAEAVYQYAAEYCVECELRGGTMTTAGPRAQSMTAYDGTTILYDGSQNDLFRYLKKCLNSQETNNSKAQFVVIYFTTDSTCRITSATWAKNKSDNLVGSYPTPAVGKSNTKYGTYYYKPNLGDQ